MLLNGNLNLNHRKCLGEDAELWFRNMINTSLFSAVLIFSLTLWNSFWYFLITLLNEQTGSPVYSFLKHTIGFSNFPLLFQSNVLAASSDTLLESVYHNYYVILNTTVIQIEMCIWYIFDILIFHFYYIRNINF